MPLETPLIADALDAVLSAILAHEERRRAETPPALVVATPFTLPADPAQIPTREDSEITALAADPIGAALRQAVRRIGQRLHDDGGTDAMREACERVSDRDPAKAGRRTAIMDHAWNGVGTDKDRWWS